MQQQSSVMHSITPTSTTTTTIAAPTPPSPNEKLLFSAPTTTTTTLTTSSTSTTPVTTTTTTSTTPPPVMITSAMPPYHSSATSMMHQHHHPHHHTHTHTHYHLSNNNHHHHHHSNNNNNNSTNNQNQTYQYHHPHPHSNTFHHHHNHNHNNHSNHSNHNNKHLSPPPPSSSSSSSLHSHYNHHHNHHLHHSPPPPSSQYNHHQHHQHSQINPYSSPQPPQSQQQSQQQQQVSPLQNRDSPLTNTFQACHLHIHRMLSVLQPSVQSEEKRSYVFNAISNILSKLGLKTFLYGSVAFKTYLPDGDIDISVFDANLFPSPSSSSSSSSTVDSDGKVLMNGDAHAHAHHHQQQQQQQLQQVPWYTKVRTAFKNVQESAHLNDKLDIRDVYFINAEVKLIKCIVNNIPIDMSSNQAGGLSTLCFLQEVDQLIGQDHLFKRSIILMKAWCYYESRILGSHHGLLSTYALTILIMYIFNVCYDDIDSPLRALYYVLQYFCQFDWDNYAISIHGPVSLQSLPVIQVSDSTFGAGEFFMNGRKRMTKHFFSNEFLAGCVEKYARFDNVSSSSTTTTTATTTTPNMNNSRVFMPKFMNIIDPLRDYNNLGRSVSKNNHLRIRRAFKKGAKSLKSILYGNVNQSRRILTVFFRNTVNHFDSILYDGDYYGVATSGGSASGNIYNPSHHGYQGHTLSPPQSNMNDNMMMMTQMNSDAPPSRSPTRRRKSDVTSLGASSPNWVRSNKVFDSKLEDCRANLFSATNQMSDMILAEHGTMFNSDGTLLFSEHLSQAQLQQQQTNRNYGSSNMDDSEKLSLSSSSSSTRSNKNKRKSKSSNAATSSRTGGSNSSTNMVASPAKEPTSVESTPEKVTTKKNAALMPPTSPNSSEIRSRNGKKKTMSTNSSNSNSSGNSSSSSSSGSNSGNNNNSNKQQQQTRKYRASTLSDYINLDGATTTSSQSASRPRQQKPKNAKKKEATTPAQ